MNENDSDTIALNGTEKKTKTYNRFGKSKDQSESDYKKFMSVFFVMKKLTREELQKEISELHLSNSLGMQLVRNGFASKNSDGSYVLTEYAESFNSADAAAVKLIKRMRTYNNKHAKVSKLKKKSESAQPQTMLGGMIVSEEQAKMIADTHRMVLEIHKRLIR